MGQHYDVISHQPSPIFFLITSMTLYSEICRSLPSINLQENITERYNC